LQYRRSFTLESALKSVNRLAAAAWCGNLGGEALEVLTVAVMAHWEYWLKKEWNWNRRPFTIRPMNSNSQAQSAMLDGPDAWFFENGHALCCRATWSHTCKSRSVCYKWPAVWGMHLLTGNGAPEI
jgi:hypothetical protein